jgi:hypothetical protein
MVLDEQRRLGMLMRSGAVFTAGGATAAVGFAAGTTGRAAVWWAVPLSLAAAAFWLVACTGATLRHGRVRVRAPLSAGAAIARAALAPVAPAVFVLALWSAIGELVKQRHQVLRDQHRGVPEVLPKNVSLSAHHRAWARCVAQAVADRDDLAALLDESRRLLGPAGQPELAGLWETVLRWPDCVVQVTDRDDDGARFGYYAVYPLHETAVCRLQSGQVTAGGQLGPADIAVSPGDIAGWYIAVIWAPGRPWTRRCVIATLVDALAAAGAGSSAQPVFGQPVTPQGRSLMRQYGFTALSAAADAICVLEKRSR